MIAKIKEMLNENNASMKILMGVAAASLVLIIYGVWVETKSGSIKISIPKSGATVFLDEQRAGISNAPGQIITLERVRPGEHSVLVYMEEYLPWEKTVRVRTNEVTRSSAFFVRKNISPSYKKTEFASEEKARIENLFDASTADRKTSFFGDGSVEIRKEDDKIFATWLGETSGLPDFFCNDTECRNSVLVFSSEVGTIDIIDFYPQRDDVVLFLINGDIYAIDIDQRGTQNFQPVYSGGVVNFAVGQRGSMVYIKDEQSLFGVVL